MSDEVQPISQSEAVKTPQLTDQMLFWARAVIAEASEQGRLPDLGIEPHQRVSISPQGKTQDEWIAEKTAELKAQIAQENALNTLSVEAAQRLGREAGERAFTKQEAIARIDGNLFVTASEVTDLVRTWCNLRGGRRGLLPLKRPKAPKPSVGPKKDPTDFTYHFEKVGGERELVVDSYTQDIGGGQNVSFLRFLFESGRISKIQVLYEIGKRIHFQHNLIDRIGRESNLEQLILLWGQGNKHNPVEQHVSEEGLYLYPSDDDYMVGVEFSAPEGDQLPTLAIMGGKEEIKPVITYNFEDKTNAYTSTKRSIAPIALAEYETLLKDALALFPIPRPAREE